MSLSSAGLEQWTYKQGSDNIEEPAFVLRPYDHVVDGFAVKHRCDDVVSSSATHGSVSTVGASRRQASDRHTDTSPPSNYEAADNGGDEDSTLKSSPESPNGARMFDEKGVPMKRSSSEDRS